MKLDEIFDTGFSMKKTVWSKRGDTVTRRDVDAFVPKDIQQRNKIIVKDKNGKD